MEPMISEPGNQQQTPLFQIETLDLYRRRVSVILLVGILLTLASFLLDVLMYPNQILLLLEVRLTSVLLGLMALGLNHTPLCRRSAPMLGFLAYLLFAGTVLVSIVLLNAPDSPYYVGLVIVITLYLGIAPLFWYQALLAGGLAILAYLLVMVWLVPAMAPSLWGNSFFMVSFTLIGAAQCAADEQARRRVFTLRMADEQAALQLAVKADELEETVKSRSRERAAAERRYRVLFDSLADDVVVVDEQGMILQSNAAFDRHFGSRNQRAGRGFLDVVTTKQREEVQARLREVQHSGKPMVDFLVFLEAANSTIIEAEISGTCIRREGRRIGVQLVIRDVRIRRILEYHLTESLQRIKQVEVATILALVKLSEYRDINDQHHLDRIREYCRILAAEVVRSGRLDTEVEPGLVEEIHSASILHDIGKVSIPDVLLQKHGPLTEAEEEQIRRHTLTGGDVIKAMEEESGGSGFLLMAKQIAYFHHERWDGEGYPHGLRGTEIPLPARILAVADAYEERTCGRDGGKAVSASQVVADIKRDSGIRFDPAVVDALVASQQLMDQVRQRFEPQVSQAVMA
jgi:PAS domain S-box-containing protein